MAGHSTGRRAITRRDLLGGTTALAALAATGCANPPPAFTYFRGYDPSRPPPGDVRPEFALRNNYQRIYGAVSDGGFDIPAIDLDKVDPRYLRQIVPFSMPERPGTVIVDTPNRFLYLVQENGYAMRYGVGIGREGFAWSGRAVIQWKRPWPTWTPPEDMIARQPELAKYSAENGGMAPGLDNPLGARALYIFKDGEDTLYRVHGTPEYWTIGKAVSSGCVRMMNQDVIDLYGRVANRAPIIVTDALTPATG